MSFRRTWKPIDMCKGSNAFLRDGSTPDQRLKQQTQILAGFDEAVGLLIERRSHFIKNPIEYAGWN